MITLTRASVCAAALLALLVGAPGVGLQTGPAERERAYRANNLGVARLEQFDYDAAAQSFREALRIDPALALGRVNLALALFYANNAEAALREAKVAVERLPDAPQAHYLLGLLARTLDRPEDAIASWRRVLEIDPADVGTKVHLGQVYLQQRGYGEAIALFREALAAEPYNVTAAYNLATALVRSGAADEGAGAMERFQTLRDSSYGTTYSQIYLEQGRYAEAIASTGAEPELVDTRTPDVTFIDATAAAFPQARSAVSGSLAKGEGGLAAAVAGGVTLVDVDADGDLDAIETGLRGLRLYRNDAGTFADITGPAGLTSVAGAAAIGAVAGDYDNDGKADLFILRYGGNRLLRQGANGQFEDVTETSRLPAYPHLARSAALVDVDHDGDLDVLVIGFADAGAAGQATSARGELPDTLPGAPNQLLRNNGDGTFTDISAAAGVAGGGNGVAVVATDFDNRRDIDLLIVNRGAAPLLLQNLRDGSFRDAAREAGLPTAGRYSAVAAGDLNKDNATDFFVGRSDGPGDFVLSDGGGRFVVRAGPESSHGAVAAQLLDYDNDGLLDLLILSGRGARLFRNLGTRWADVTDAAALAASGSHDATVQALALGDVDGDGDTDALIRSADGELRYWRNQGGNRNPSLQVRLAGRVSNRSGVGSKVELRAGSLRQRFESSASTPAVAAADFLFGLGPDRSADVVRILWPSGTLQAETDVGPLGARPRVGASSLAVTELDRKPSSCPYLYTWNGSRFEFVTDFMGGGEIGYWVGPGTWNDPDPDEYVRIRGDQLVPRDGRYELRVTNELEETTFIDRLELVAVDHPAGVEVYPGGGRGGLATGYGLQASGGEAQASGSGLWALGSGGASTQASGFALWALGFAGRASGYGLEAAGRGLWTAGDGLRTAGLEIVTTGGARVVAGATDEHGHDVRARLASIDRTYVDDFALSAIRGYAEPHTLTLDLGGVADRAVLLMTGWTDYAFSGDNVAAHQSGRTLSPPALQVRDARGRWRTAIENIGIPVGRPQTVVVHLGGKVPPSTREVRIVTNMRIYWDRALVDRSGAEFPTASTRLDPVVADLRWRGFSAESTPDGRPPMGYDYGRVSTVSPWKVMTGRYTREGDVRPLLAARDDMFVVSRPGDETALSFEAASLPPLRPDEARTFLLYVFGYSKEMDINSASPHTVEPLPFHGMSRYPYGPDEHYPRTAAHRRYLADYNTRIVRRSVPAIDGGR